MPITITTGLSRKIGLALAQHAGRGTDDCGAISGEGHLQGASNL